MRTLRATLIALLLLAAPAQAGERPRPQGVEPPNVLPVAGGATIARAQPSTWLVGARPGRQADMLAARFGARKLTKLGIYAIGRGRATSFTAALRAAGVYRFAEPNHRLQRAHAPGDEFMTTDWRAVLVPPGIEPPPVSQAPLTAVIDGAADTTVPDLAGVQVIRNTTVDDLHGTAVASVIAGRANGVGMVGMYPGAPVLSIGTDLTIADVIQCIQAAIDAHAAVINMSYGSPYYSYGEDTVLAYAVSRGVVPVAAAGNDRETVGPDGTTNPVLYPAALPHIVSVAATGPSGATSAFSTSNGAVDLAAPGEGVLTAVPTAWDDDGLADGYERLDGTSFAAPIVAGAAAWLRAARPNLSAGQIADVLRLSATDIGATGWDEDSGYGLVNIKAALTARAPASDTLEVNDDISWVDGRRLGRPDPFVKRSLHGVVDYWKDYADVYRVQVPAHRTLRLTVKPAHGTNPDLAVYSKQGRSVYKTRGRLAWSSNRAGKSERITIRNASRRARTAYAAVYSPTAQDARYDAPYTLSVKR